MRIEKRTLAELKPAAYNPRKDLQPGDPEYEKIRNSLETFGYVDPIIVNQDGTIIGGHQRWKVLGDIGEVDIDCVVVDLPKDQEKALNIALNKISGEWDDTKLASLLQDLDLQGLDLSVTGFDRDEIKDLLALFEEKREPEDDEFNVDEALPDEPVSRLGDIWNLGRHRLICGDATDQHMVDTLLDGQSVQLIFTDPPWNVDYGSDTKHPSWRSRQILNDKMSTEDFHGFLLTAFENMAAVADPGCMTYVVMSAQEWGNIMDVMQAAGYHWSSTIIWAKDTLVLSRKDYHTQYEPIWYGWLDGSRLCPLVDRKQSDVWEVPRPKRSEEHPTMKPVPLVARAIQNSSQNGDVVLDLFGGSGTTLIAAEQTGRCCYMLELDPKYADVIVKRYMATAGTEGISLIRGGEVIESQKVMKFFED